ncbi:MAG: hypothetical protein IKE52_05225 [Mogibacterium sp.]|nr:hypothetical protein [Mogibacterium sp.]
MNNIEQEKIGAFIAQHSIIRYVTLTTHVFWFFPVVIGVLFYFPLFLTPVIVGETNYADPIGRVVVIALLIAGIILRLLLVKLDEREPGKSMYLTELLTNMYVAFAALLMWFKFTELMYGLRDSLIQISILIVTTLMSLACTHYIVRDWIKKGKFIDYEGKIGKKIAHSTTGRGLIVYIVIAAILRSIASLNFVVIVAAGIVLYGPNMAMLYYLKLRYAKKYGLEEYLPDRPLLSEYTGEE